MKAPTAGGLLIALASRLKGLLASQTGALPLAVDLPTVTDGADRYVPVATGTKEQPVVESRRRLLGQALDSRPLFGETTLTSDTMPPVGRPRETTKSFCPWAFGLPGPHSST